ncbi:peptide-methionine (S)-S-oxide reductase [Oleomonas cavernae]|uniref:Peptide methionine sulfoxide reductase MsrA n=1 Tax=Oleomonas cavernae TaxID=2320859 RepID=A0A418WBI6_9PROT|nr:peptide-methionine (S)-S-oxide reductase MsrA [Oleomonas cavernae]RJF87316.1 peptide-methionine (S)-S-oxide reductase [Oleomonas cavernae]
MVASARMTRAAFLGLFALLPVGALLWRLPAQSAEAAVVIPPPAIDVAAGSAETATAVFAGGCFWGVQGVFQHVTGVTGAVSGYAGGAQDTAIYQIVGSGRTGHAEAVEISYDPRLVSYGTLLQVYFSVAHDPTQLNRQGPDTGTQYRSTVFPQNAEQQKITAAYIAQLNEAKVFAGPIATTLEPGKAFYPAERYHQDFLTLNPTYPYIVYNDLPKIENLERLFPALYREKPVLVGAATN